MGAPSHAEAPTVLRHAGCRWLQGGLSLQRSLLSRPFRNMGLLFFSTPGEHEYVSTVHPCPQIACSYR